MWMTQLAPDGRFTIESLYVASVLDILIEEILADDDLHSNILRAFTDTARPKRVPL